MNVVQYQPRIVKFLHKNLWWLAPVVIIGPLAYFSGSAVTPPAAYFGTKGIWSIVEKMLDQI